MNMHLVGVDPQKREHIAILRSVRWGLSLFGLDSLDLRRSSWYIIEIKHGDLISRLDNGGDVDILSGNFHLVEDVWRPSTSHLVGIEAKCAINRNADSGEIDPDGIRATHSSPSDQKNINNQVRELLEMGFNRVGYFDFIGNPPQDGEGSFPWSAASVVSNLATEALLQKEMHSNFRERPDKVIPRFEEDLPVGHWIISIGSVAKDDERFSGAEQTRLIKPAIENPRLQDHNIRENRMEMEESLLSIFQRLSIHSSSPYPPLPIILVFCQVCHEFHYYSGFDGGYFCPRRKDFIG